MTSILVVEDERDLAEPLAELLEHLGFRARIARDGGDALAKLEEELPDVVLTDLTMPGMSGHALIAVLQTEPRFRAIKVVVMTAGFGGDAYRERGIPVIQKPFPVDRLVAVIDGALAGTEKDPADV